MLLGFKSQFIPYVKEGSKTHTIRALGNRRLFREGDVCDCYGNVRQKSMFLVGRWPCVRVERITIAGSGFAGSTLITIGRNTLDYIESDVFAWRDGFRWPQEPRNTAGCFALMCEFWRIEHRINERDFRGQLIHWDFSRPLYRNAQGKYGALKP